MDEVRLAGAGHMLVIVDEDGEILIPAVAPIFVFFVVKKQEYIH